MQRQFTCEHCGATFARRDVRYQPRHCSRACRLAARITLVETRCQRCGVTMSVYPFDLKWGNKKFCSRACWGIAARKESFDASLDRTGECWLWTGSVDKDGYGRVRFGGRRELAHRVAWTLEHGPIPDGMEVRHLVCDNPPCCRPEHLALGTHSDNMRDAAAKGRLWMQRRATK